MTSIRRLAVGSVGPPVRKLEQQLKQRGLLQGPVDNFFDAKTKAAVKRFEHQHGWKEDGVVGGRISKRLHLGLAGEPGPKGDGKGAFNVVSMNVKSNPEMSQDKVVHDVRRAAKSGDIIGLRIPTIVVSSSSHRGQGRARDAGLGGGRFLLSS